MSVSPPSAASGSTAGESQPLAEIERFLDRTGELARSAQTRSDFLPVFLGDLGTLLGAAGVQFWELLDGDRVERLSDVSLTDDYHAWAERPAAFTEPLGTIRAALAASSPIVVVPSTSAAREPGGDRDAAAVSVANPSPFLWIASTVHSPHRPAGVVLVCRSAGIGPAALRRIADVVGTACELAADFFGRRQVRDLLEEREFHQRLDGALDRLHACETVGDAVLEIVNEGRRVLACDRCSLLLPQGRTWRVAGVSGIEAIEHRSDLAARLTCFAEHALAGRSVFAWEAGVESRSGGAKASPVGSDDAAGPTELDTVLQAYVDESHARRLTLHVLERAASSDERLADNSSALSQRERPDRSSRGDNIGVLVCEWFRGTDVEGVESRTDRYRRKVAPLLANLADWERAPVASRLRHWRRGRPWKSLRRGGTVLAVLAGVVAAMVLIPWELRVEARGVLQPALHRDVFAPRDGTIVDLPVDTGGRVEQGAPLLSMRNEELDLEQQRVDGDLATARKQILAIETSRLENRVTGASDPGRPGQLTAELEQLRERVAGLEELRRILSVQQAELKLVSPIAGRVLTWNLKQTLDRRPVRRGQRLLTLADETGPWELELWIPDHRAGFVRTALERGRETPPVVDYTLATEPGLRREAPLGPVGSSAEVRSVGERPTVLGEVRLPPSTLVEPRPGTSVVAKIRCGMYPLGYVLFHEVWEAIWRAWVF
jgi:hypothetical protein